MEQTTTSNLPPAVPVTSLADSTDLLSEILSLLPAQSLMRFKSVSHRWLSLITDPVFASLHRSRNPRGPLLLIPPRPFTPLSRPVPDLRFLLIPRSLSPSLIHPGKENTPLLPAVNSRSNIVNALVCFYSSKNPAGEIHLFNLTTRESLLIPPPEARGPHAAHECRLGYDPGSGKYEILHLSRSEDLVECHVIAPGGGHLGGWRKVDVSRVSRELGTFSSRRWDLMESFFSDAPAYVNECYDEPGFCLEGRVYWNSHYFEFGFRRDVVMVYNVGGGGEEGGFGCVGFPEEASGRGGRGVRMASVRGRVSLVDVVGGEDGRVIVWGLVEGAWVKEVVLGPNGGGPMRCSELGLLSRVRSVDVERKVAVIEGFDLGAEKPFRLRVRDEEGLLKVGRGVDLVKMVENIVPLKSI